MIDRILHGDIRSVAQAISLVENDANEACEILKALFPKTGNAYRIGITGPPGVGKSTLTDKLAKYYLTENKKVGIIAIDPTSPFSGGAILGDRIRMSDIEMDKGVFIRSMASRGNLGGLSRKAKEAADILDAAGYDIIIIETVGVGQSELDILRAVDTTVVVLVPESGDGIQAMKAGLMEIADLFVINKADRPGADQESASIEFFIGLRPQAESDWQVRVLKTEAHEGKGIIEVAELIARHRAFLHSSRKFLEKRKIQLRQRINDLVGEKLQNDFWNYERNDYLNKQIEKVLDRSLSPYDIVQDLYKHFEQTKNGE